MRMLVGINYANQHFRKQQKANTLSAKLIAGIKNVIEYSPNDIDDDFKEQHQNIFQKNKGGGYWLWKPFIILKTLKTLNDGDYLFYCDSGAIFLKSIKPLIKEFNQLKQPILAFQQPLIELQWTKRKTFEIVGVPFDEVKNTPQLYGGYLFVKKNTESMQFFETLLKLCLNEDALVNTSNDNNVPEFIDHRHDQSIFSLLFKKYGYTPLGDLSDYGKFPEAYCQPENRIVAQELKSPQYAGTILSVRGANPLTYASKYFIKRFIKKYFPFYHQKKFNKRNVHIDYE
jgi:hypothetical protein